MQPHLFLQKIKTYYCVNVNQSNVNEMTLRKFIAACAKVYRHRSVEEKKTFGEKYSR